MPGDILHDFDLRLCGYVLAAIRRHMSMPAFADYVGEVLDPAVLAYLNALGGAIGQPKRLLSYGDFAELAVMIEGGPPEFDLPWPADARLHRRSIDCASETRTTLGAAYADEWARESARFTAALEDDHIRLTAGIDIVHDWVRLLRRYLLAMGATAFLPPPEGTFPTPSCPDPPLPPAAVPTAPSGQRDDTALAATLAEIRDLIVNQRTVKDFYTTAEVAEILSRAEYTVREWCRQGQVKATKAPNGRSWLVSHAELTRVRNHGPLPIDQVDR